MKKEIKKWGNSLVIRFSPEEMRINDLKEGSIVDLSDMIVKNGSRALKRGKKGNKK